MLEYSITAATTGPARATAQCKDAQIELDTDLAGRADAFNPAELLLTAVAACMLKGIERVGPMLGFQWRARTCACTASGRMRRRACSASTTRWSWTARRATPVSSYCTATCET